MSDEYAVQAIRDPNGALWLSRDGLTWVSVGPGAIDLLAEDVAAVRTETLEASFGQLNYV